MTSRNTIGEPRLDEKRNVLIFQSNLISYSETFIPAQAEKFTQFTPYYIGFGRVKGGKLPEERTLWPSYSNWGAKIREWASLFGQIDPRILRRARTVKPQILHAHFEFGGLRALPLAESLPVPLVVTCHGMDVSIDRYQWQNRPMLGDHYLARRKRLFREGHLFLGVSRFICDQMIRRGYPPEKVRLHYIGVDIEKFQPNPTAPKEPMILFVGRLIEKKGCHDLLRAMKKVAVRYPEVKLNIIGDGPQKGELEAFARQENLRVEFCGAQPPEVVRRNLDSALIFSMPSVRASNGDSEGLGIVNLEAQACGVPVVGTWHGGIPEAVEHGVTGLLSPERDSEALAENILTLLSNRTLLETMSAAARKNVVLKFDLAKQTKLLETMYLEILEQKAG
jgi:colanic acid/amylovoran biosynthesis glycosyltransferase